MESVREIQEASCRETPFMSFRPTHFFFFFFFFFPFCSCSVARSTVRHTHQPHCTISRITLSKRATNPFFFVLLQSSPSPSAERSKVSCCCSHHHSSTSDFIDSARFFFYPTCSPQTCRNIPSSCGIWSTTQASATPSAGTRPAPTLS